MKRIVTTSGLAAAAIMATTLYATPANADTTVTVESRASAVDKAQATAREAIRLKVNGADQVSWEEEDHDTRVNSKAIKAAPHVHVNPDMTSRDLYRKTDGATVVIAYGEWKNHGMLGKIKVPFIAKAKKPGIVLVWNSKLRVYEHAFTLKAPSKVKADDEVVGYVKLGGKRFAIVKSCNNDFGGRGKPRKVKVVRFAGDVEMSQTVDAFVAVTSRVTVSKACPGGNVSLEASATASAAASSEIFAKAKVLVTTVDGKKAELLNTLTGQLESQAMAAAETYAKGTITCGDMPEKVVAPDLLDIGLINRVLVGNTIAIDLNGKVAVGHTAELFCKALNGGTISAGKVQTVSGTFAAQIGYTAPGEIPDVLTDGQGDVVVPKGHDMVECTLTQDDGQKDVIRTEVGPGKFEIFEMPADPQ